MRFNIIILFNILLILSCPAQNTDINLLRKINVHRNTGFDETFILITKSDAPVSIAVPLVVFGAGFFSKNEELKNNGFYIAASLAVTTVVAVSLKYSINRTRPFDKYPDIEQVIPVTSSSFPSGHTSIAFSTATSLSIAFPRWYVITPAYIWASSVAYSRMHLGEHYPSDVVAGMIIGAGSAYLCYRLQKIFKQKNEKKANNLLIQE